MDPRSGHHPVSRWWRGSIAAVVLALAASPVSGDTPPTVIRTAPATRAPNAADVATTAARVAVVWTERDDGYHGGGNPRVFLRTSADRGTTWDAVFQVEAGEHSDQPSAAICAGRYLLVAYAVDLRNDLFPKRWHIILYQRDLDTGDDFWEEMSTGSGRAQYPDVACASDRAWVVFDDTDGSERHVYLRHAIVGPPGTMSFGVAIDLGRSRPTGNSTDSGPGVAAVNGAASVAWGAPTSGGTLVRFKRYGVGAGPGHPVSAGPTKTLRTLGIIPRHPLIAASGDRVVVVYPIDFETFGLRRSVDGGASFKSQQQLHVPLGYTAWPGHLSMRGARVLLLAPAFWEGPADTIRYLSANGGGTFSRTLLGNNRGARVGGLVVKNGITRYVEAWDGHWYNDRKLRFHRQS